MTILVITFMLAPACSGLAAIRPALPTRTGMARMKARYEDGEDKRLSQGGSGGGIFAPNKLKKKGNPLNSYTNTESRRFSSSDKGQMIRKAKLEAYIDNDMEGSDPMFGKIIAGSFLVTLFALLFAAFNYYGTDGLAAATYTQRAVRGM